MFTPTIPIRSPTQHNGPWTVESPRQNKNEEGMHDELQPTVISSHPPPSQLSMQMIRRLYYEYIHPMLPIFSHHTLSKLFAGSLPHSTFHNFLGTVLIAATAPFLGPEVNLLFRNLTRNQVINEYYHKAKVSVQTGRRKVADSSGNKSFFRLCLRTLVVRTSPL